MGCVKMFFVKFYMAALKKSPLLIACLLLIATTASTAMSLGRSRGAALIGRPLDISVQAILDAQETPANLCLEADVFYADNKLEKFRVLVSAEKAAGSQNALIRIRSSVLVDEPVVTVNLRAGCQQKNEKRYVLLADLVPDLASSQPAAEAAAAAGTAEPAPAQRALPAVSPSTGAAPGRSTARSRPDAAAAAQTGSADAARQPAPKPKAALAAEQAFPRLGPRPKPARVAEKSGPRLKLEPVDLSIERDPVLKASTEMLSTPASSDQERSVAAALWRALSAQPQDILRDAEKIQALESSVLSLRAQAQKNQLAIKDLTGQLEKAQSERYANMLVYGLGLLLLLALVAIAYLWRRWSLVRLDSEEALPWWRKDKPQDQGWSNSLRDGGLVAMPIEAESEKDSFVSAKAPAPVEPGFASGKRLPSFGYAESSFPAAIEVREDFSNSMPQIARTVKAEELVDVQQQADFFVSLGQHEQAIEVLRGHIGGHVDTSALVYLDLFDLYHQLGRKADYEDLRDDFNELFNAKVPAFDLYTDTSPGLEVYETAMSRIEALWPSSKALELIEESIFRKPDATTKAFDLEAYRELLLLYGVAKEINKPRFNNEDSVLLRDFPAISAEQPDVKLPSHTSKFMATSIQPLSANVRENRHLDTLPGPFTVLPKASPRLGLDIDLDELSSDGVSIEPSSRSALDNVIEFDFSDSQPHSTSRKIP